MSIPKHILQIALNPSYISKLPLEKIKMNILSVNPGYTYTLLDDNDCLEFLVTYHPDYLILFTELVRPQYKSDLIRYLYTYTFGGFYVDIDLLPTIGFDSLCASYGNPKAIFTLGAHTNSSGQYHELANGFFGSEAKNYLFLSLAHQMLKEPNPSDYGMNVKRIFRTLSYQHSMTPYSLEDGILFVKEFNMGNGTYNIVGQNGDHICFSNGHGYPFVTPKL
jgi:hypothetical protein